MTNEDERGIEFHITSTSGEGGPTLSDPGVEMRHVAVYRSADNVQWLDNPQHLKEWLQQTEDGTVTNKGFNQEQKRIWWTLQEDRLYKRFTSLAEVLAFAEQFGGRIILQKHDDGPSAFDSPDADDPDVHGWELRIYDDYES